MKKFVECKQYIGQLELLAAVVAYYTLAEQLRDRKVVHMIDHLSADSCSDQGLLTCARLGQDCARLRSVQPGDQRDLTV
jgi:hypothetical protein